MRAKEFLREIRRFDIRIRQKKEEITLIREQASCVPGMEIRKDRIQSSPDGQGFTRLLDKAADLERELRADVAELQKIRHERILMIQQLDNETLEEILFQRYVFHRSLQYIAEYLQLDYSYIRNAHGTALMEFEKKFPEILKM